MKKHAIIPIFIAHKGCPNACVFCNQRAITATSGDVSISDARKTIDEWLTTLDKMDIEKEISFFGGSFTGIPAEEQEAFLSLAKEYKDAGRVQKIHCSTRPDYINKEILDRLKYYSMDVIELGVQSFDQRVLKASKRGHGASDVYKACDLIKEYGFSLGIQLMIGLPEDSYESCIYSAKETVKIAPDIARLYPTVVIEGTELSDMKNDGRYTPKSQDEMLKTVKDMYKLLTNNGINVIRIGLKSNELIKGETYHEAFGELVKSSIAMDELKDKLKSLCIGEDFRGDVRVEGPQELINFAVGHKAENRRRLESEYPYIKWHFVKNEERKSLCVIKI